MPKFSPPKEPDWSAETSEEKELPKRAPIIYVPIDEDWMPDLEIGKDVEITLRGKIHGYEVRKTEKHERAELDLEVEIVELYGQTKIGKLIEDSEADDE